MLISTNAEPNRQEFEVLMEDTLTSLRKEAHLNLKKYLGLGGEKLEDEVFDILKYNSKGTPFEGSIELILGQGFPDIIAKKYYGIEVKTTQSKQWKSIGSSVAEGTRVNGIERIFMLFAKIRNPIEFMCRPYEDCLSAVVVTHSPRYQIDMNLKKGETFFDKLEIPYDILRKQPKPIKTILDYYRKQLKKGEDVWYLDLDSSKSTSLIIRIWNNLTTEERADYMIKGFCLFPELVTNRVDKFNRFAIWLSTREGVVCPCVRDIFSAGGQGIIDFEGVNYSTVPQIIMRLYNNIDKIKDILEMIELEELREYWQCDLQEGDRFSTWFDLIITNSKSIIKTPIPLSQIMKSR